MDDSNAAVPAVRGQPVNSRSRPHSGQSSAQAIAAPTTGLKVLQTWPVARTRRSMFLDGSSIAADAIRRRRPIECLLVKVSNWRTRPVVAARPYEERSFVVRLADSPC
jgi:hypothetical protein